MSFNTDSVITAIGNHRDRVALIADHGGTVPAAYRKAEQRWDAWNEASSDQPMTALTDAYADGADESTLATLRAALERAGATILEGEAAPSPAKQGEPVTKSDLFQLGLSGKADSAQRRKELQRALGLPERLSANGLVQAINALYSREEFLRLAGEHTTKGDG